MPKVRFRVPVEVDVTEGQIAFLRSLAPAVRAVRENAPAFRAVRDAAKPLLAEIDAVSQDLGEPIVKVWVPPDAGRSFIRQHVE